MNAIYDNELFTKIRKRISSKNEISHNLFVDTHSAQNINERRIDIQVVSQQIQKK